MVGHKLLFLFMITTFFFLNVNLYKSLGNKSLNVFIIWDENFGQFTYVMVDGVRN